MTKTFAFGTDPWDPTHRFQTSWLVSPYVLFALRALMAIYAFTTLLFNIGYQCARPALGGCAAASAGFSYFTVLTYWGIAFYALISSIHTLTYALSSPTSGSGKTSLLDRFPRPLQALHSLYYSSVVTYPFLVTIVYWAILFGPAVAAGGGWFDTTYEAWSNVSQHALNSAFALCEVVLPRAAPMPWLHVLWLIVVLALYCALAYVTRATKGFYTYAFLDPGLTGDLVAAYVFGIAVAIVLIFAAVWGLIWVRVWATETRLRSSATATGAGAGASDEEEMEMGLGNGSTTMIARK